MSTEGLTSGIQSTLAMPSTVTSTGHSEQASPLQLIVVVVGIGFGIAVTAITVLHRTRLMGSCPNCGRKVRRQAKFCDGCGITLKSAR